MESSSLRTVRHQVERLLQDGISVIPVRDKDCGTFVAKSPYRDWKEFQSRIISREDLWKQMDQYNTTAIATICGGISRNLEAIDIDVKYNPGVDGILFRDIKTIYPELWDKLRIHKSPSGGFHLLYRVINGTVPGNMKLAGRPATGEELQKSKTKVYNFIETRGEGGYVLAPPSLGYSLHKNAEIPLLTWEERCALIQLCKTYTQIVKVEPVYKLTKAEDQYYEENPFEDYNRRVDPIGLMQAHGWQFYKENSRFIRFTRPGKSSGISASFNREKRIFFNFTASTELDENKGYHPATLLSIFAFGGDKKRLYGWLVDNGYGKVKPKVEQQQVSRKARAGEPLPANFSQQAREEHARIQQTITEKHPYGIFWEFDEDSKLTIDRMGLYQVAEGLGFRLFNDDLVQIDQHLIFRRNERHFYDQMKLYIQEEDADLYKDICNAFEAFIEKHGKFTISRLPILPDENILKDTAEICYKFFQNCYVKITEYGQKIQDYSELQLFILHENVQQREYHAGSAGGGLYVDFINKAIVKPSAVRKVIGYLSHQWKDETTGYIIVLTEEVPDPRNGGGSGKNLFSKLLSNTTTYLGIPGAQVKYDEKFLQSWNYQRIMAISDVPKKFDFGFLKELSTGVGILKKLWKDEASVPVELMPKFIVETNYSYEITDGGLARRIIPVEFTNFFTVKGGVDVHFGRYFPRGWTVNDWAGYDNFIFECVQEWLSHPKLSAPDLTAGGWQKQFEQEFYPSTYEFIKECWKWWTRGGDWTFIPNDLFNQQYDRFYESSHIPRFNQLSCQRMNKAIKKFCDREGYLFEHNVLDYDAKGSRVKGRKFSKDSAPF